MAYIIAGAVGIITFFLISSSKLEHQMQARAEEKAKKLIKENEEKAEKLKAERKVNATESLNRMVARNNDLEGQLEKQQEIVTEKEELANKRDSRLTQLSGTIKNLEKSIEKTETEISALTKELSEAAAKKAGVSAQEVLDDMYKTYEHDFVSWKEDRMHFMENPDYKDEVNPIAKSIVKSCLERYVERSSVDTKEFSFELKFDAAKGPMVGKGGKMINYFEEKAECAVIFNYEPNLVIVSCLNMYKRAIAKEALTLLSHKKHIDEKTVDEMLEKAKAKIDKTVVEFGKRAAKLLGYKDLPEELIFLIGKFEFRTSYGQNIWWHSMEVAYFARMLAESINANVQRALDAAFYHDLGKAIDHDLDEAIGHDHLSKELMEKFEMDPLTIHAAYAHHDAVPCIRPEDFIVKAADAMSAARPGARQQTIERYLQLVKELTERASNFEGVKKAFTVNAAREVRVVVDEKNVDDSMTEGIAERIAQDIEDNMGYPGTIKINVIRSTHSSDVAKEKIPMKRY